METEQNAVASQESVETSQEQKPEASQEQVEVPIIERPEVKAAIQSEADKRAKVHERKLEDVKAEHRIELRRLQEQMDAAIKAAESQRDEVGLDGFLKRYVDNGEIPETSVPPIRDFAKKTFERERTAREKEAKANEVLRKAEEKEKEVAELKATRAIRKVASELGVPISDEDAEAIAKKTDGNLSWAEDIIRAKAATPTTEKPKPRRPDSSAPTASGGRLTDTELRANYASGKIPLSVYERECKERGIPPA